MYTFAVQRSSDASQIAIDRPCRVETEFGRVPCIQELKYAWSCEITGFPVFCELHAVLYMAGQYSSPTLVLGFTVERYIAVCHPFRKQRYCTAKMAARVSVAMVTFCLAVASAQVRVCVVVSCLWWHVSATLFCLRRACCCFSGPD